MTTDQPENTKENPLFTDLGEYRVGYIDLLSTIEETYLYEREFDILRKARKGDEVLLTINTPGGFLSTAVQFVDAIEQCKGKVTARLVGEGYSAGSLIFLACKNKEVGALGSLMIHRESGGTVGKGSDTEKQMDFMKRYIKEVYGKVYSQYLSPEDMEKLLKGEDFWFTTEETKELIKND